jgi:hypothetical protein
MALGHNFRKWARSANKKLKNDSLLMGYVN